MEIEYKRVIYNIKNQPSPKTVLVTIPMYMYRIKTTKLEYGLDFFQKAVLKLKYRSDVDNTTIARYLCLEEDLINEIQQALASSGYLTDDGLITERGREMCKNSIIVDDKKEELGYVFKFVNEDRCFPYYVNREMLGESPNYNISKDGNLYISVGTKGDGEDRTVTVYPLNSILKDRRNMPPPNAQTIIDLIIKTAKKKERDINDISSENTLMNSLTISFIPNNADPDLVGVCTCVYLPQREDGLYEPEWQVLDPFIENENSVQLKFYLQSSGDEDFKKKLDECFDNAKTLDGKNFTEFSKLLEENVERIKEDDLDLRIKQQDKELQKSLNTVIRSIYILRLTNYTDNDSGQLFYSSCQKALETIFLVDQEKRKNAYSNMKNDYSTPPNGNSQSYKRKRKEALNELIRNRIIVISNYRRLISLSKVEPIYAISLKQYIYICLLTYYYDNSSILFKLIKKEKIIDQLFDIAVVRNMKNHGSTDKKKINIPITKEEVEKVYSFLRDFINQYIKYNYEKKK